MIPGTWISGIGLFAKTWWKAGLGFVLGAMAFAPLAYCEGRGAGAASVRLEAARAENEVIKRDSEAKEQAAVERRSDDERISQSEKELHDVIANAPAGTPGPANIALACERLRRQGASSLPEQCRPGR